MSSANRYIWIGGRKFHDRWQWDGNVRKDIVVADWYDNKPENFGGNQHCLYAIPKQYRLQWDDGACSYVVHYLCEKFLR